MGNGRQNHKFSSPKNRGGILLYCAGADGNTCGRKSRGDEKQLINLEWPNASGHRDALSNDRRKSAAHFERPAKQALALATEPRAKRESRSVLCHIYLSVVR